MEEENDQHIQTETVNVVDPVAERRRAKAREQLDAKLAAMAAQVISYYPHFLISHTLIYSGKIIVLFFDRSLYYSFYNFLYILFLVKDEQWDDDEAVDSLA